MKILHRKLTQNAKRSELK